MLAIKQTLVQTCGDQALKSSKIYDQHSGPLSETERFFYGAGNEVRGHGTATCADVVWAVSLQIQAVGETGVLHFNRPCKTQTQKSDLHLRTMKYSTSCRCSCVPRPRCSVCEHLGWCVGLGLLWNKVKKEEWSCKVARSLKCNFMSLKMTRNTIHRNTRMRYDLERNVSEVQRLKYIYGSLGGLIRV